MNSSADLLEEYRKLTLEEGEITNKLDNILNQQCHVEAKLRNVSLLVPHINTLKSDAQHLSEMIQFTSTLAENVSAKVRKLDSAKGRVSECQNRVNDLLDLQLCREGVIAAMKNEDYEKAAAHVHRFLSIDENTLKLTAGDVAQGPTVDSSLVLLREAQAQLCRVLHDKFDQAVKDDDTASVERFFKIFPLLNMHEEGISKFGNYLAGQLKNRKSQTGIKQNDSGESNNIRANVYFADTLTVLLESVARTIEIHQPLLETYYGPGRLIQVVGYLQPECDGQGRQILAEFRSNRQLERQIRLVKNQQNSNSVEKCDARLLDVVLAELTLLSSRLELYFNFLRRRIAADLEIGVADESIRQLRMKEFEKMLESKFGVKHGVQELLGNYIMLERYFLSESVSKAISMDSPIDGSLTSSVVDDVFFLVKKSIRRSLTTCNVDSICAVINNACTVLEEDYSAVFQHQCKQGFPSGYLDLTQAYSVIQSSLQQGSIRLQTSSDTEKSKANFLTTLNNIDTSIEYIETLEKNVSAEIQLNFGSLITSHAHEKIQSCLAGLKSTAAKFRQLLQFGHEQLKSSAIKPRIKPWVDQLLSVNHVIDEEEFSCYEAQDPFVQELIVHLDGFIVGFRSSLTPNNCQTLIAVLASQVAQQFEKVILKSNFNRLGAIQLDKEVRALVAYLSTATTWTIRDRLTRLTQIVTLLNMEKLSEMGDYWGPNASGSISWRLTPPEVRQVLILRTDFRPEDVKRLKL